MYVIVVDCNVGRHKDHKNILLTLNVPRFEINEAIDVNSISELDADILVIHKNNDEFCKIESSEDNGKIRIFFSDGYHTEYVKDNYNYYVPFENIEKTLQSLMLNLDRQNNQ